MYLHPVKSALSRDLRSADEGCDCVPDIFVRHFAGNLVCDSMQGSGEPPFRDGVRLAEANGARGQWGLERLPTAEEIERLSS